METSDKKVLQRNLAQFLIGDVFNAITDEDILEIKSQKEWRYGGRKLDVSEIELLKSEAETLEKMLLWKLLNNRKKQLAQEIIVTKSKGEDDLIAGKMILYLLDVDKSVIKSILEH